MLPSTTVNGSPCVPIDGKSRRGPVDPALGYIKPIEPHQNRLEWPGGADRFNPECRGMTRGEAMILDERAPQRQRSRRSCVDREPARGPVRRGRHHRRFGVEGERHAYALPFVSKIPFRPQRQCPVVVIETHREARKQLVADKTGDRGPIAAVCQITRQRKHGERLIRHLGVTEPHGSHAREGDRDAVAAAIPSRTGPFRFKPKRRGRLRRHGIHGAGVEHQRKRPAPVDAHIDDHFARLDRNGHDGLGSRDDAGVRGPFRLNCVREPCWQQHPRDVSEGPSPYELSSQGAGHEEYRARLVDLL
jgi:hypothetical protein